MPDLTRDAIVNWVSDFCQSDALGLFPGALAEHAQGILETLLEAATSPRQLTLERLDEPALKHALLEAVARLALPQELRPFVPSLCRAFLEDLQHRGRIGNGQGLGRYVGALRDAFLAAGGAPVPFQRPGGKIGRNDPCPCGSGRKYKKCCGQERGTP
jgi:hypothetical protein